MHTDTNGATSDQPRDTIPAAAGSFADFLRRVRAGDGQAAEELVRKYEAAIRLEIRLRLRNSRLRRVVDSMDICQSVLASFFVRAAAGQYDLDAPGQLLKLLVVIARSKVAYQLRRERAQRRDHRRVAEVDVQQVAVTATGPSPSQLVIGEELLQRFREQLTDEERRLADLRMAGHNWVEIAAELGGTADARRVQWSRAVERVAQQLGLEA
jgi:RNA polymerase sigma-70 factor (ECF subfamily)